MKNDHEQTMQSMSDRVGCQSLFQFERRTLLKSAASLAVAGQLGGWTQVAEALANHPSDKQRPKSLIFLWLQGGPSQLETFDPHPNSKIGGPTKAIETSLKGIQVSDLLPQTAEIMHLSTLVRSVVSKEGDHERATYTMKTGWRPDPTLVHPSIGAVLCHQTPGNIEIPRHISILSSQWPARGGYMGPEFDAFQVNDPKNPIANLESQVEMGRKQQRMNDLTNIIEKQFKRGRLQNLDAERTLHETSTARATTMMGSDQISAFHILEEPKSVQDRFGDTPFGRGCLAAIRLVQQGVRCVEVELGGWDTHAKNFDLHRGRCGILDTALHGLITELEARDMLEDTIVVCGGEFGRTPSINVADGRDHWPNGFSTAIFGGPFRRGYVHGTTTHEALETGADPMDGVKDPVPLESLHATILSTFGIEPALELQTPVGRPLALSNGKICRELLDG